MTGFFIVNGMAFPLITQYGMAVSAEPVNQTFNEMQIVACE
jgi:hypothetical protein